MPDFQFVRSLIGMIPQAEEFTAGGTIEVGDLLVWSSGKVVKAADGALQADNIAGLAMEAGVENGIVSVLPVNEYMLLEGLVKDSTIPDVGAALHIDVTSNVMKFEGAASGAYNAVFQLYKVVNATGKIVQARFRGVDLWAAVAVEAATT